MPELDISTSSEYIPNRDEEAWFEVAVGEGTPEWDSFDEGLRVLPTQFLESKAKQLRSVIWEKRRGGPLWTAVCLRELATRPLLSYVSVNWIAMWLPQTATQMELRKVISGEETTVALLNKLESLGLPVEQDVIRTKVEIPISRLALSQVELKGFSVRHAFKQVCFCLRVSPFKCELNSRIVLISSLLDCMDVVRLQHRNTVSYNQVRAELIASLEVEMETVVKDLLGLEFGLTMSHASQWLWLGTAGRTIDGHLRCTAAKYLFLLAVAHVELLRQQLMGSSLRSALSIKIDDRPLRGLCTTWAMKARLVRCCEQKFTAKEAKVRQRLRRKPDVAMVWSLLLSYLREESDGPPLPQVVLDMLYLYFFHGADMFSLWTHILAESVATGDEEMCCYTVDQSSPKICYEPGAMRHCVIPRSPGQTLSMQDSLPEYIQLSRPLTGVAELQGLVRKGFNKSCQWRGLIFWLLAVSGTTPCWIQAVESAVQSLMDANHTSCNGSAVTIPMITRQFQKDDSPLDRVGELIDYYTAPLSEGGAVESSCLLCDVLPPLPPHIWNLSHIIWRRAIRYVNESKSLEPVAFWVDPIELAKVAYGDRGPLMLRLSECSPLRAITALVELPYDVLEDTDNSKQSSSPRSKTAAHFDVERTAQSEWLSSTIRYLEATLPGLVTAACEAQRLMQASNDARELLLSGMTYANVEKSVLKLHQGKGNLDLWRAGNYTIEKIKMLHSAAKCPLLMTLRDSSGSSCDVIVKLHDDVRSDVLVLRLARSLIERCKSSGVSCPESMYRVVQTYHSGARGGWIEVLANSTSFHDLGGRVLDIVRKRSPAVTEEQLVSILGPRGTIGLRHFFALSFGANVDLASEALRRFCDSLAFGSVLTYLLAIKDRHNGNILVRDDGSVFHIDFGFILEASPGNDLAFERAPFKLTAEMIEILSTTPNDLVDLHQELYQSISSQSMIEQGSGRLSRLLNRKALKKTALSPACQSNMSRFRVQVMSVFLEARAIGPTMIVTVACDSYRRSEMARAARGRRRLALHNFGQRLFLHLDDIEAQSEINRLMDRAIRSLTTRWYDRIQRWQQGINYV